ncbi:MAG: acyl-CoA thioesterase [Gammaproteobacteria bacterium]|nr:acyl-CoA thioesterase [Gammaproteobacteria bacterium]
MTRLRILYADTDLAGVVYHANYLRYFEQARTELLYAAGVDLAQLHQQAGIVFAISDCALRYHRSAHYGDVIEIDVFPTKVGPARVTLGYTVTVAGQEGVYVTGETTFAALDAESGRVVRLPEPMRRWLLAALEERTDG